jgi:hypothetical protein
MNMLLRLALNLDRLHVVLYITVAIIAHLQYEVLLSVLFPHVLSAWCLLGSCVRCNVQRELF